MINVKDFSNIERVIAFFEEFSAIPHGSSNTAGIAKYLTDFAEKRGLFCLRDEYDNVLIRKPATKGFEDRPAVIIQGHTDMVAVKTQNSTKDLLTEGIEIYRDGDFLRGKDTSLGGDDGIAIAYALAILDADDIPHPKLEALFTSDEEIGLIGASKFDASVLEGKIMLNIDSDDDDVFTVGCAGGARVDVTLGVESEPVTEKAYTLTVSGGLGGHSGGEINKGRSNAIKLGGAVISALGGVRIAALAGGAADNAIARDFRATIVTNEDIEEKFAKAAAEFTAPYITVEPNLSVKLERCDAPNQAISSSDSERIISLLCALPNGIQAMSENIAGLVETSLNTGIIELDNGEFHLTLSVRSAKSAKKQALIERIIAIGGEYGASVSTRGEYPAWEYRENSHIRDTAVRVFKEMYNREPMVIIIHAGLECGIFSDKIEGVDCISMGPDNFDIHTTEEHLSLPSVSRFWEYLKEILKQI